MQIGNIVYFIITSFIYITLLGCFVDANIHTDVEVLTYSPGDRLYSNREYFDSLKKFDLNKLKIIKLKRHEIHPIILRSDSDFILYRGVHKNNNIEQYRNWNSIKEKIFVEGQSINFTDIVFKKFKKGEHIIQPGGSIATPPTFIKTKIKNASVNVINIETFNQFTRPIKFHLKRITLMILGYFAYLFFVYKIKKNIQI